MSFIFFLNEINTSYNGGDIMLKKIIVLMVTIITMALACGCTSNAPTATIEPEGIETIITENIITE